LNQPQTYFQTIVARVTGYCAGRQKKVLLVCAGKARGAAQGVAAYLKIESFIDLRDVTDAPADAPPLTPDAAYGAVLIACDATHLISRLRAICAHYQAANIPVLVVAGWPPPMDAAQFAAETAFTGNLTVPAMFEIAARYCTDGPSGDYLEFGTFQGYTLQCAYHAFQKRGNLAKRRFIAFDSFAGIVGAKENEGYKDGAYAASETSFRFANMLAQVPNDRVVAVPGAFQDTLLTQAEATRDVLGETEAAIVHIDCDVEEPAKLALDFVTPYVRQGSLLMFDEYDVNRADNRKGERAALRAWLAENPQFEIEPYRCYHVHARAFILHTR